MNRIEFEMFVKDLEILSKRYNIAIKGRLSVRRLKENEKIEDNKWFYVPSKTESYLLYLDRKKQSNKKEDE